ncbi:hypothetical protein BX600DRAFT_476362 [Xylariales sp. PMI_506]|nr:hypothetical protein BX600DRAFT_476362 [Xylariales sp. PMI_506]
MALRFVAILIILFSCYGSHAQDSRAEDPNNHFVFPPLPGPQHTSDPTVFWDNINITYGVAQTKAFQWVSDMSSMQVTLEQEGDQSSARYRQIASCSPGSNNLIYWDGQIDPIDLANGTQAYLAAWNCSEPNASPIFFSHYFNLTAPTASTANTSETTNSTTPTATGSGKDGTQSTSSAAGTEQGTTKISTAAVIGGSVAGGVGGSLVFLLGVYALLRYHRKKGGSSSRTAFAQCHDLDDPMWKYRPSLHSEDRSEPAPAYVNGQVVLHKGRLIPSELA